MLSMLQWAQADEDVVFEAVKQNRFAFRFAAESLRTGGSTQRPFRVRGMISTCAPEDAF